MVKSVIAVLGLAIVAGLTPGPAAQQPPQEAATPQQPSQPTFRTGTNLVRVDVTVIDQRGHPVTSLTADDFDVEEDGFQQIVQSFKLVEASGQPVDEVSLPIRSREHAAAEAARDDVRVFLIFWDEYHIGQFVSAIYGRRMLANFVASAFAPTDLVAIMDPLTLVDTIRFTRDRSELSEAVQKLQGRRGVFMPTRSAVEEAHLQNFREIGRLRAEVTFSALRSAAVHLGTLREGRKAILLVSEGLPVVGPHWSTLMRELTESANANNTAIYTVDPRGLGPRASDALWTLARETGARAFLNMNLPDRALQQIVREASAFYLLGYVSSRSPMDGRFHRIRVRVRRSGLEVRARSGYWAPSETEIARARAEAAAGARAEVLEALALLPPSDGRRTADIWVGTARGADGLTDVTVVWTPRRTTDAQRPPAAALAVTVQEPGDGGRSFEGAAAAGRSFSVRPGVLKLEIKVRDAAGEIVDRELRQVTVPDFSGDRLALSSPLVLRARGPAELRAIGADPQPAAFAGREFSRTDRLLIRFAVYSGADAAISARLLSRLGASLRALQVAPLAGRADTYQIDLPLSGIARGEYLVAIEATGGEERVETLVPIRVVS